MRRQNKYVTLGGAVLALAALATLSACEDPTGATLLNDEPAVEVGTELLLQGTPQGTFVNDLVVVDLDTVNHPDDVFGRSIPTNEVWDAGGYYELGTSYGGRSFFSGRWWHAGDFNGDPRLPPLQLVTDLSGGDEYYGGGLDFLRFYPPPFLDVDGGDCTHGPCWWIQNDLDHLGPDHFWMVQAAVRYATQVNGKLDHIEMITEGEVTEPDQLVPLPFQPGGYPEHDADWIPFDSDEFTGDPCPDVPPDANPFIFGHLGTGDGNTNAGRDGGGAFDGEIDADWCFTSAGNWSDTDITSGTQPLAPNAPQGFDLPTYNYVTFYTFDKAAYDAGTPAMDAIDFDEEWARFQAGVDIDMDGNPIPHAYAPFPFPPGSTWDVEFGSRENMLAHPNVAAAARSSEITLRGVPSFEGMEYQVYLHNQATGEYQQITVNWVQQRPDTVGTDELGDPIIEFVDLSAPANVQSFGSQGQGMRHVIELEHQTLADAGTPMGDYSHVVIFAAPQGGTVDPARTAAAVSFQFIDLSGTPEVRFDDQPAKDGDALFSFLPGEVAAAGKSWAAFGGGNVTYQPGGRFGLRLNRIARPPAGWYYEVWGVTESEEGEVTNEVSFGEVTTPAPDFESLLDADVSTGEYVTDTEILQASKFVDFNTMNVSGASGPSDFTRIVVTLEPKDGGPERSPIQVFTTGVPNDLEGLDEAVETF